VHWKFAMPACWKDQLDRRADGKRFSSMRDDHVVTLTFDLPGTALTIADSTLTPTGRLRCQIRQTDS
jgi:hypothetical protein